MVTVFEWIYENIVVGYTVTKIHRLINIDLLKENILNKEFRTEVDLLDERFRIFMKEDNPSNDLWWVDFTKEKIIWGAK